MIQLSNIPGPPHAPASQPVLFALCDDGTMWAMQRLNDNAPWRRIKNVPQEEIEP